MTGDKIVSLNWKMKKYENYKLQIYVNIIDNIGPLFVQGKTIKANLFVSKVQLGVNVKKIIYRNFPIIHEYFPLSCDNFVP